MRLRVVSVVGTRPEAIKLAPVIRELAARPESFEQWVVATAQHRELLDQVLGVFEIVPDFDLDLMEADQTLANFASRSLAAVSVLFEELDPHVVLVQGDTTTVMTAALAAFYRHALVGHVEAGLRSFRRDSPFPEEINRRIAGVLADLHFAPTERARQNLLAEGVADGAIHLTGNTIVDALAWLRPTLGRGTFAQRRLRELPPEVPLVLVTVHRRENHGDRLRSICSALREVATRFSDVAFVLPVHPSPRVRATVESELGDVPSIVLTEPLDYDDLLRVLDDALLVLTDSGGIQEEAPSFQLPVLVLRDVTERPELVEHGFGVLVGADPERIVLETTRLLSDPAARRSMTGGRNPFGDGRAAQRIVDVLEARLPVEGGRSPLAEAPRS